VELVWPILQEKILSTSGNEWCTKAVKIGECAGVVIDRIVAI
jgi:hypothetical protein